MRLYGSLWVLIGTSGTFQVFTHFYGFVYVLMGPYLSSWVHIGPYASL